MLSIKCRLMSETRQAEPAVTLSRRMAGGTAIDAHRHDGNQIVYASRGVLSVTTDAGAWIAPTSRAIWVPAGAMHEHRAYGVTVLHTVGLPGRANPLRMTRPAVLVVGPAAAARVDHRLYPRPAGGITGPVAAAFSTARPVAHDASAGHPPSLRARSAPGRSLRPSPARPGGPSRPGRARRCRRSEPSYAYSPVRPGDGHDVPAVAHPAAAAPHSAAARRRVASVPRRALPQLVNVLLKL